MCQSGHAKRASPRPRLRQKSACSVAAEEKRRSTRAQEGSGCFSGSYCQALIARGIESASSQSSLPPPTSGWIAFNVVLPELLFLCLFSVCVLLSRISEAACSYYVRPACTIVPLQQIQKIQAGGKKSEEKDIQKFNNFWKNLFWKFFKSAC